MQGGEHDHTSHVSIPCKCPGFPSKSSRNGFALYSLKAAIIVLSVKDMKEAISLKISETISQKCWRK